MTAEDPWLTARKAAAAILNSTGFTTDTATMDDIETAVEIAEAESGIDLSQTSFGWSWVTDRLLDQTTHAHHELKRGRFDWAGTKFC